MPGRDVYDSVSMIPDSLAFVNSRVCYAMLSYTCYMLNINQIQRERHLLIESLCISTIWEIDLERPFGKMSHHNLHLISVLYISDTNLGHQIQSAQSLIITNWRLTTSMCLFCVGNGMATANKWNERTEKTNAQVTRMRMRILFKSPNKDNDKLNEKIKSYSNHMNYTRNKNIPLKSIKCV